MPVFIALALGSSCASREVAPSVDAERARAERFERQVSLADANAARGCYLCLKEAAQFYSVLAPEKPETPILRKAIENDLMIVLRERELRLPDSGALERAQLSPLRDEYLPYFSVLEAAYETVAEGHNTWKEIQQFREERRKRASELELGWPASAMKAYFYLTVALGAFTADELKPQAEAILDTHSTDLSLQYRKQAFAPSFSEDRSRELLSKEPGFAEINFLLAQHAIRNGQLQSAFRELRRSRELLPDSAAMSSVMGDVELALARYPEALAAYERVIAAAPEDEHAQLGRAKALSYVRRHQDALAVLDVLLRDVRNNPGEKYYWRAWNRLRIGETEAAYQDATTALKAMVNPDVFRLAGITALSTGRLPEARRQFDSALGMQAGDCDSLRYLAQIDSLERRWPSAVERFTKAAGCYAEAIERMSAELTQKEADITGLSNGLITALRTDIAEAQALQENARNNAQTVARNIERP